MTVRGFIFLMVVGVAASIVSGLVVERFTAPGLERTLAFAAPVCIVLYLAGWCGEKLGWMGGRFEWGKPQARPTPPAAANNEANDHSTGEPK